MEKFMALYSKLNNKQHGLQQHVLQERHHTGASQSEAYLPKLPVEILEMITAKLDNYGLKSIRATCRHLYIGSIYEFTERHTSSNVGIMTTNGGTVMRKLTVTLRSPNPVKAQTTMTEFLALHDPLRADEKQPERTVVSNTVTFNPSAWEYLQQKNYRQNHGHTLAPLIFKRIAILPPQTTNLRRLIIEGANLNGDDLLKVLGTHRHHLRRVTLCKVTLTKFVICVRAVSRVETQRFEFEDLKVRDTWGREQCVTKDRVSFPQFKYQMSLEWEPRSGYGWSHFVYERKSDTGYWLSRD